MAGIVDVIEIVCVLGKVLSWLEMIEFVILSTAIMVFVTQAIGAATFEIFAY